ncbi:MAG: hypothetical protein Q7U73_15775 [Rubrivivax sp.]|nr:hypothetical protein [Rubrivivax sp.]
MQAHTASGAPRDFTPGAGLPGDRGARLAAREAFVSLKRSFLDALESVPAAEWLRVQVRAAEEPVDLWLLRAPVFAALSRMDADSRTHRQRLHRSLDTIFLDLETGSAFMQL